MREQEMRLRVFRFLKARMRNMIMPATIGIGLAVGGCSDSNDGTVVRYAAPVMPDASPDLNPDVAGSWVLNLDVGADDGASARDLPADARDELTPDLPTAEDASSADVFAAEAALDAGSLDGEDDLGGVEQGSPLDAGGLDSQSDVGQVITPASQTPSG
jgi:hypothetical protein